ncbi:MAG: GIY-YIG nuclease family protein [Ruthenibacterium sp.]
MNYIYMLECGDKSLYTGWTTDIARRVAAHQSGKGAKYTRAHLPVTLVYTEEYADKSTALRREIEIKALSREEKLLLIAENPQKDCSL